MQRHPRLDEIMDDHQEEVKHCVIQIGHSKEYTIVPVHEILHQSTIDVDVYDVPATEKSIVASKYGTSDTLRYRQTEGSPKGYFVITVIPGMFGDSYNNARTKLSRAAEASAGHSRARIRHLKRLQHTPEVISSVSRSKKGRHIVTKEKTICRISQRKKNHSIKLLMNKVEATIARRNSSKRVMKRGYVENLSTSSPISQLSMKNKTATKAMSATKGINVQSSLVDELEENCSHGLGSSNILENKVTLSTLRHQSTQVTFEKNSRVKTLSVNIPKHSNDDLASYTNDHVSYYHEDADEFGFLKYPSQQHKNDKTRAKLPRNNVESVIATSNSLKRVMKQENVGTLSTSNTISRLSMENDPKIKVKSATESAKDQLLLMDKYEKICDHIPESSNIGKDKLTLDIPSHQSRQNLRIQNRNADVRENLNDALLPYTRNELSDDYNDHANDAFAFVKFPSHHVLNCDNRKGSPKTETTQTFMTETHKNVPVTEVSEKIDVPLSSDPQDPSKKSDRPDTQIVAKKHVVPLITDTEILQTPERVILIWNPSPPSIDKHAQRALKQQHETIFKKEKPSSRNLSPGESSNVNESRDGINDCTHLQMGKNPWPLPLEEVGIKSVDKRGDDFKYDDFFVSQKKRDVEVIGENCRGQSALLRYDASSNLNVKSRENWSDLLTPYDLDESTLNKIKSSLPQHDIFWKSVHELLETSSESESVDINESKTAYIENETKSNNVQLLAFNEESLTEIARTTTSQYTFNTFNSESIKETPVSGATRQKCTSVNKLLNFSDLQDSAEPPMYNRDISWEKLSVEELVKNEFGNGTKSGKSTEPYLRDCSPMYESEYENMSSDKCSDKPTDNRIIEDDDSVKSMELFIEDSSLQQTFRERHPVGHDDSYNDSTNISKIEDEKAAQEYRLIVAELRRKNRQLMEELGQSRKGRKISNANTTTVNEKGIKKKDKYVEKIPQCQIREIVTGVTKNLSKAFKRTVWKGGQNVNEVPEDGSMSMVPECVEISEDKIQGIVTLGRNMTFESEHFFHAMGASTMKLRMSRLISALWPLETRLNLVLRKNAKPPFKIITNDQIHSLMYSCNVIQQRNPIPIDDDNDPVYHARRWISAKLRNDRKHFYEKQKIQKGNRGNGNLVHDEGQFDDEDELEVDFENQTEGQKKRKHDNMTKDKAKSSKQMTRCKQSADSDYLRTREDQSDSSLDDDSGRKKRVLETRTPNESNERQAKTKFCPGSSSYSAIELIQILKNSQYAGVVNDEKVQKDTLYTFHQLAKESKIDEKKLRNVISTDCSIVINDKIRLVCFPYELQKCMEFLSYLQQFDCPWDKIDTRIFMKFKEVKGISNEMLHYLRTKYLKPNDSGLMKKFVFKLNPDVIHVAIAAWLLERLQNECDINEFGETFMAMIPKGMPVDRKCMMSVFNDRGTVTKDRTGNLMIRASREKRSRLNPTDILITNYRKMFPTEIST